MLNQHTTTSNANMTNTSHHEKDILALHLGGWQWPKPSTWTPDDVTQFLRRCCGIEGLDQIVFDNAYGVLAVVHGILQRLPYDQPTVDDCQTLILALGGLPMNNTSQDWEQSLQSVSDTGTLRRVTVAATPISTHTSMGLQNGFNVVIRMRPTQATPWHQLSMDPALKQRIEQTQTGIILVGGGTQQGKTALMNAVARSWVDGGWPINVYEYIDELDFHSSNPMLVARHGIDHAPKMGRGQRRHVIGELRDIADFQSAVIAANTSLTLTGMHSDDVQDTLRRASYLVEHDRSLAQDYFSNINLVVVTRLIQGIHDKRVPWRQWLPITEDGRAQLFGQPEDNPLSREQRHHLVDQLIDQHGCSFEMDATRLHQQGQISDQVLKDILSMAKKSRAYRK